MKRTRVILLGITFLSLLTVASCGPKKEKAAEAEKKECCEKKDSTSCCEKKDSTACEKKCGGENAATDTTKKN